MDSTTFCKDGDGDEQMRPLAVRPLKAAEMLGISISSLRRLTIAGELPMFKHDRKAFYRVATLDAWLAQREASQNGQPT
jgi:hypothetical protein